MGVNQGVGLTMARACAVSLGLALALTACGGGGGSAPPPTVAPSDDQYTVPAGAQTGLSVLANDNLSAGTSTLSVPTAPAHGKVTVQGSTLSYTPDVGYFGQDQFTYRVDLGPSSGTATVKLTVEAEIELSGSVPSINSLTDVTAQIGDSQVKVRTDDAGAYKLSFKTSTPNAFITLTARESGARAAMVRTSLVGEAISLYAQAGARINATQWPALALDALSTARHGLLLQHGQQPATTNDLRNALAAQDPIDLLDIATLLRHVYEDNATLPAGAATTTELAASPAALRTLNRQWLSDGVDRPATIEKTLAQVAATTPPAVSPQGSRIISMYQGSYTSTEVTPVGSMFDLGADGSATGIVWAPAMNTAVTARWTRSGDTLTVNLASPLVVNGSRRVHAQQMRQLRGIDTQPSRQLMVRWLTDCQISATPVMPSCAEPSYTAWVPVVGYDVERDRQPLRLEDFVSGTTWAGVILAEQPGIASCMCSDQPLVTDGTPNVSGFQGQLVDGRWLLTGAQTTHRYTRLGAGPEAGTEYWLMELLQNGTTTHANLRLVAKASDSPTFDTSSTARRWASGYLVDNGSTDVAGARFASYPQILHRDGRMNYDIGAGEVGTDYRWFLSADKRTIMASLGGGAPYALYTQVRAVSGGYLVVSGQNGSLHRIRDEAPAD